VDIIRHAGATPAAVLIALDRMERAGTATEIGESSAVQNVEKEFGMPVVSIANLASLMSFLESGQSADLEQYLPAVKAYRDQYGI
jgi:orotate phosphoribosyltransferase